jgi:hypothetical protein
VQYEVILCTSDSINKFESLRTIVDRFSNIAAYEIISKDSDAVISFGVEIALGDWVIILEDHENFQIHFTKILETITAPQNQFVTNISLIPHKFILRDRALVRLSRLLMQERVETFQRVSKASTRESLTRWNRRAFKSKVLRVASNLNRNNGSGQKVEVQVNSKYNSERLFRIGIRTIIYSSVAPLRFVGLLSIAASGFGAAYSAYVFFVRYQVTTAPGWASTNLILSGSLFLLFIILAAICEYLYQLIGATVQNNSILTAKESISSKYSYKENENVRGYLE